MAGSMVEESALHDYNPVCVDPEVHEGGEEADVDEEADDGRGDVHYCADQAYEEVSVVHEEHDCDADVSESRYVREGDEDDCGYVMA